MSDRRSSGAWSSRSFKSGMPRGRPVVSLAGLVLLAGFAALTGCSRFQHVPPNKYVYVTAKEAFLRDRVAAVSQRSGTVENGEQLTVLERSRHFVKVRTPRNEVGWLDDRNVATQAVDDAFEALNTQHAGDAVVGQATTRDEVYLHAAPGRDTDRFYRLAEGQKLQLLDRATLVKAPAAGSIVAARQSSESKSQTSSEASSRSAAALAVKKAGGPLPTSAAGAADLPAATPPPVLEDWWLVRTPEGHTGWIYSHMIDVDAPDALVRYAEGQRIVGAYVLAHVNDPESGQLRDGQPDPDIPEYVTVLGPYKGGLPYDFNQVRVFTWNTKKHRYETAFREKNIEGFLPLTVFTARDPYGKTPLAGDMLPAFQYKVLPEGAPTPVPNALGELKPNGLITKTYRLEGSIVRRILAPGAQPPAEAHPDPEPDKKGAKKRRG